MADGQKFGLVELCISYADMHRKVTPPPPASDSICTNHWDITIGKK